MPGARLRRRDLQDLREKRPALVKQAYTKRARTVLRMRRAQTVASRIASSLKHTCAEVDRKGGAASRG